MRPENDTSLGPRPRNRKIDLKPNREMASRGQTSPATKARVVLQPLKVQKPEGSTPEKQSREIKKNTKTEESGGKAKNESRPAPETPRPIPDIKEKASEIENTILAFCLDPSKKINKDQAATIMKHFKEMRGIVEELLLHNSYLTGKLEQSAGTAQNRDTEILTVVNKSLQVSKRLETAVKKTARTEPKQPSYAEKVKINNKKVGQISVKPPKNVVIIRPEQADGEIRTSEEAREAVFTLVNPRKRGIQVTAVRKIGGNGLAVQTTNPEGLKAFTENVKLKEAGLKASTPQRRQPRMILFDVPRDMPEKELRACIRKQNEDRLAEEDVAAIKFCFRTGRKDAEEINWVIEAPPQVREKLLRGKIYVSWNACKVRDFIAVSRCYKCQGYGHIAKYCRIDYEICAHCAESGHSTKECTSRDKNANCVNCRKAGKKGDHAASNADCPMHKKALEALIARTEYE